MFFLVIHRAKGATARCGAHAWSSWWAVVISFFYTICYSISRFAPTLLVFGWQSSSATGRPFLNVVQAGRTACHMHLYYLLWECRWALFWMSHAVTVKRKGAYDTNRAEVLLLFDHNLCLYFAETQLVIIWDQRDYNAFWLLCMNQQANFHAREETARNKYTVKAKMKNSILKWNRACIKKDKD